jgi:patatin-like phospholipase/acyl hydrolase
MAELIKVLAIDGGGIRGVIPATVLAEIETRTGSHISELFDLVAGTSTGGILALGLVKPANGGGRPDFAASDLAALYEKEGTRIFSRSLWHRVRALDNLVDERYEAAGIESVLQQYFGEAKLSEALTETLVTSYELQTRTPWFFARHKALESPADNDFPMRFVARATSAAPTYFEPEEVTSITPHGGLVDGGVYANNPAMCAYVEARKLHGDVEVLLVSLGTGEHTRPIAYAEAKGWGLAQWAKPILDVVFDGVSDTVDHQMSILCQATSTGVRRYFRFQPELTIASDDMDNASTENIDKLRRQAHELVGAEDASLDELCNALTAKAATPAAAPA